MYVGSRFISWREELVVLNRLRRERKVPFNRLAVLYLTSKHWQYVRSVVLRRDGYKCVRCGSGVDVHVDHMKYPKSFGKEDLDFLQTLCAVCHVRKTKKFDLRANMRVTPLQVDGDEEMYAMMRVRAA